MFFILAAAIEMDIKHIKNNLKVSLDSAFQLKPYPLLVIDNLLTKEDFKKISSDYKKILATNTKYEGINPTDRNKTVQYLTLGSAREANSTNHLKKIFSTAEWSELLSFFSSEEFSKIILNSLLKKYFKRKSMQYIYRDPNWKQGLLQSLFQNNYFITFKFSRYPSGSNISPHRDLDKKIIAFMYYLGYSDGKNRQTGGTQFWTDNGDKDWRSRQSDHFVIDTDKLALLRDVSPIENRLAFFVRNDQSWHSVEDPKCPKGITRDNLQINFMKSNYTSFAERIIRNYRLIKSFFSWLNQEILAAIFFIKELFHDPRPGSVQTSIKKGDFLYKSKTTFNIWTLKRIYHWVFKNNLFIVDPKRRFIRSLINKYCEPVTNDIYYVANYALDFSRLRPGLNAFCFGVYDDIRFEEICADKFAFNVMCADPTPIAVKYIKGKKLSSKVTFIPEALWIYDGYTKFYYDDKNKQNHNFEGSIVNMNNQSKYLEVPCKTLNSFKRLAGLNEVNILKMDIEGAAIDVLSQLISDSKGKYENLPEQIPLEIETHEILDHNFQHKLNSFLGEVVEIYNIYYIPRLKRFNHLDILLVLKKI